MKLTLEIMPHANLALLKYLMALITVQFNRTPYFLLNSWNECDQMISRNQNYLRRAHLHRPANLFEMFIQRQVL